MNKGGNLKTLEKSPKTMPALAGLAFLTGFSGAMMPGPLLAAVIQQTAVQQSFAPAFWLLTGHALLEAVLLLFLMFGLRAVLSREAVRGGISLVGGLALVYMGADMMRASRGLTLQLGSETAAALSPMALMLFGAAICLANPYFTGWWATIGTGQLAWMAPKRKREYLAFFLGHEASDYSWYFLVAAIILTGRRWISDGVYQGLILMCGLALVALGLWFLFTAARLVWRAKKKSGVGL